jgi:hypothetical protein
VHVRGQTVEVPSVAPATSGTDPGGGSPAMDELTASDTVRAPLGRVAGARSGDKGGDANLGVFARSDAAYQWLNAFLTIDRLRQLLPEIVDLVVERYPLANLRAVNFVIRGLLEEGVAASSRMDPQAKSLGEWLRARIVDVPVALLEP